jgi:hypothetical protein
VTDQAITWIRDRDTRPLFLFVHYYDVHSDYSSLPQYERLFVQPYSGIADGTGWQLARASFEDDFVEMCHRNYDPAKCRIGTEEKYLAVDRSVGRSFSMTMICGTSKNFMMPEFANSTTSWVAYLRSWRAKALSIRR